MTNGHNFRRDPHSGLPIIGAPKPGMAGMSEADSMLVGFAAIEAGTHQLLAHEWPPETVLRLAEAVERLAPTFDAKSAGGAAFREAARKFAETVRRSVTVEPAAVQPVGGA